MQTINKYKQQSVYNVTVSELFELNFNIVCKCKFECLPLLLLLFYFLILFCYLTICENREYNRNCYYFFSFCPKPFFFCFCFSSRLLLICSTSHFTSLHWKEDKRENVCVCAKISVAELFVLAHLYNCNLYLKKYVVLCVFSLNYCLDVDAEKKYQQKQLQQHTVRCICVNFINWICEQIVYITW